MVSGLDIGRPVKAGKSCSVSELPLKPASCVGQAVIWLDQATAWKV